MKIYLKEFKKTRKSTIKDVIYFLLSNDENEIETTIYNNVFVTKTTYNNKKCTGLQCISNKRRSFEDIVDLCKTYFHNATDKKIAQELEKFIKEVKTTKNLNCGFLFCPHIDKWVFTPCSNNNVRYCNNFGNCSTFINKKIHKYSLIDILTLMGYKKSEFYLT
jgi:hypothetical protein